MGMGKGKFQGARKRAGSQTLRYAEKRMNG
jgi:hypothetical protein